MKQPGRGDFYQRFTIEVGALELLLKGGAVFYFLYTIPLWYVAIKSIFRYAHLKMAFYIGIYILTELLIMFIENIPYFSFQYAILFFLAGYTYRLMYLNKKAPGRIRHQPGFNAMEYGVSLTQPG
jgi:hypothetical protein